MRRLIVNADDFGRSRAINQAVIRAHREGILTTASLMVNGEAFTEAVALAKATPTLGVGLHLTLLRGTSTLAPAQIPNLVNPNGEFGHNPLATGWRYFFHRKLQPQLVAELEAQFAKFRATGLPLDHVNGHLHIHLHPVILSILEQRAETWDIRYLRLTRDPLLLNLRIASGAWLYRLTHALIYGGLSRWARSALRKRGIRHTNTVIGLLQNARVDETFLLQLLPRLPTGDTELYSHPSLDAYKQEFHALVSPAVRALTEKLGIRTIRYQDL